MFFFKSKPSYFTSSGISSQSLVTEGLIDSIFYNFVYLFLAALGPQCCSGFSAVAASRSYSLIAVRGLLIAVASLVVKHQLQGTQAPVVATSGILPDQG